MKYGWVAKIRLNNEHIHDLEEGRVMIACRQTKIATIKKIWIKNPAFNQKQPIHQPLNNRADSINNINFIIC